MSHEEGGTAGNDEGNVGALSALGRRSRANHRRTLEEDHPTALALLDETGAIAHDRFFGVGCLILRDAPSTLRAIQKLRDRHHWYREIHWSQLTRDTLGVYSGLAEIIARSDARFSCFVSDRGEADSRDHHDRDPWHAYEDLATRLLIDSIRPYELVSVIADNYSTPDNVHFEREVRAAVNARLGRLAAVSVCRLDSRSCDPLQVADLLTGAVTFEFRQQAGLAGQDTPKAQLAARVRELYGVATVLEGAETRRLNVKVYR